MNTLNFAPPESFLDPVCAVILAAGCGTRLREITRNRPKCLVEVAGKPILSRMLDELESHGIREIIIVVGYLNGHIRRYVADYHSHLCIRFVENAGFAETGSLFSLDLAIEHLPEDRHLLIVEGDVVLAPGLCSPVLTNAGSTADGSTLLAPYEPHLSGTFALVENNRVIDWNHESVRESGFPLLDSYKTVNVILLKRDRGVPRLREAARATIRSQGRTAPVEYAMRTLVCNGLHINAVGTGGAKWCEVDTPEDLALANGMFGNGSCTW